MAYGGSITFYPVISFNKLISFYEHQEDAALSAIGLERKTEVLQVAEAYPELRDGIADPEEIGKYSEQIDILLRDCFPEALGSNEIKSACAPSYNLIFKKSARMTKILADAGADFAVGMREVPDDVRYIFFATVILKYQYQVNIDFNRPNFYDIPDARGLMKHYRAMYNADFMEIIPTEKALQLSNEEIDALVANTDDIGLWRSKIPPESFVMKGFVFCNLFDVTADQSISNIKSNLIGASNNGKNDSIEDFQRTFRELFNLPDLEVGFTGFKTEMEHFFTIPGQGVKSFCLLIKHPNIVPNCFVTTLTAN